MGFKNAEIKARCANPEKIRKWLKEKGARFAGIDHQTDTYFKVPVGRMKIRDGNIEKALIWYQRPDRAEARTADGMVVQLEHPDEARDLFAASLGILVEVKKRREIYFLDHVKFHIDELPALGSFMEIEVQDHDGSHTPEELHLTCRTMMEELEIRDEDLVSHSYSDMLLKQ